MMTTTERPQVWVGCLACYNAGNLNGEWVDAIDADDARPCTRPDHEELWVFDFEGFGGLLTGECSPMEAARVARLLDDIPSHVDAEAVAAWIGYTGAELGDWADIAPDFEEAYCGTWRTEEDYAQDLAEDIGAIDDNATWPAYCIDWERAARELFSGDCWSTAGGDGVYVFRSI